MAVYLLSLSRKYFRHYDGLSEGAWLGIVAYLLESCLMGVFYFLSVYFVKDLHLSVSMAGAIVSCYGVGAMAGGWVGGKCSDAWPPAWVVFISLLIQAMAYSALLILMDSRFLMLDMVLLGVSSYSFITACQLWVLSQCQYEAEKIRALNILSTASNLGLAVSAMLVGYFALYGFKTIFVSTSLGFLLLAVCLYQFGRGKGYSVATSAHQGTSIGRHRWMVLGCVFLVGMVVSQLGSTYAIYIEHRFLTFGTQAVSVLFFLNSLLVVLVATPVGNYLQGGNKLHLVGIGGFLIGVGMLMLALHPSFEFALLACAVYTLGEIIFFCMAQYVCYCSGSDQNKGQSLGLFRMVYASSRVAGPIVGGFVYQDFGANSLWYGCGAIGMVCLAICLWPVSSGLNK